MCNSIVYVRTILLYLTLCLRIAMKSRFCFVRGLFIKKGKSSKYLLHCKQASGETQQERMSRIYQEELARIMQAQKSVAVTAGKDGITDTIAGGGSVPPNMPAGLFPGLFGRSTGPPPNELQRAVDIYQQELAKLQQNAIAAALAAQKGGKEGSSEGEKNTTGAMPVVSPSPPTALLKGGLLASGAVPGPEAVAAAMAAAGAPAGAPLTVTASHLSPLQRMASITNSLVSHPQTTSPGSHNQRPARAALPPITQQQFDKFQHLNTDETVRRVSLRLFNHIYVSKVYERCFLLL